MHHFIAKAAVACAAAIGIGTALTTPQPTAASTSTTATVAYVPRYGVAVWQQQPRLHAPGRNLKTGSSWRVFTSKQLNGKTFLNLGGDQWLDAAYADKPGENTVQTLKGTITTTTRATITTAAGGRSSGRTLPAKTNWHVSRRQIVAGTAWYEVGRNQWLSCHQAQLTHEQSRGSKQIVAPSRLNSTITNSAPQAVTAPAINTAILELSNAYRRANGRPALRLNNQLNSGAATRAHDEHLIINARGIKALGHTRPNGQPWYTVPVINSYYRGHQAMGENAVVPHSASTARAIAQNMVNAWINSPGHRKTLLGNYRDTGIGVERLATGQWVGIQLFGR